jgi:hypothetical protein
VGDFYPWDDKYLESQQPRAETDLCVLTPIADHGWVVPADRVENILAKNLDAATDHGYRIGLRRLLAEPLDIKAWVDQAIAEALGMGHPPSDDPRGDDAYALAPPCPVRRLARERKILRE